MKDEDTIVVRFRQDLRSIISDAEWEEHCRRFGKDPVTGDIIVPYFEMF